MVGYVSVDLPSIKPDAPRTYSEISELSFVVVNELRFYAEKISNFCDGEKSLHLWSCSFISMHLHR